jgi:hypothetical protein
MSIVSCVFLAFYAFYARRDYFPWSHSLCMYLWHCLSCIAYLDSIFFQVIALGTLGNHLCQCLLERWAIIKLFALELPNEFGNPSIWTFAAVWIPITQWLGEVFAKRLFTVFWTGKSVGLQFFSATQVQMAIFMLTVVKSRYYWCGQKKHATQGPQRCLSCQVLLPTKVCLKSKVPWERLWPI